MTIRRDSALLFLRFISVAALSAALLLTVSCATKKDFVELRQEMHRRSDEAESRLLSIENAVSQVDSFVREQQRLSQSLRAMMGTQTQEQRDNIELIAARQDEINYQLRELLQRLQAIQLYGGIETAPASPAAPQASAPTTQKPPVQSSPAPAAEPQQTASKIDPNELYNAALDDVRNSRFQLAESRFLSFIMQFPNHELAGNAQYWLGEAVYGQEKYDLAISEFEKVISKYKKSPKIPASMLKIGFAQYNLGKSKEGAQTLNRLIKTYPKSEEADLARERINNP